MRHAPLAQALRDFADDKRKLLELLEPVGHAAERLDWLKEIVDAGEIFHLLRWTPKNAMRFFESVETMEASGLIVCMPASRRMNRPSRPEVETTIGSSEPSRAGVEQMLDFDMRVTLDGETLTDGEIASLLESTAGLALLRGKWVEIDRERLKTTLERFAAVKQLADTEGLPFAQASGKFARLAEIAETVASRQEKLLVFIQFKEIIAPLERLLASIFGRSGVVLHGDTPVAKRKHLVETFQNDEKVPFFFLSLKAGGSGLTLTAASHVAHFDR